MDTALHNRAAIFTQSLEHLSAIGLRDAFINEVMETHGRLDPPTGDLSHLWELELHGCTANGSTEEEAIANWKRLISKSAQGEDIENDGFITVHPTKQQFAGGVA